MSETPERGVPGATPDSPLSAVQDPPPLPEMVSPASGGRGPRRRLRLWLVVLAAFLLVATVVAGAFLLRGQSNAVDSPSATEQRDASPTAGLLALSAPKNLTAKGHAFEIALSWAAPSPSSPVDHYEIQRNGSFVAYVPAPSRRYVDKEVIPGHHYSYVVRAERSDGSASTGAGIKVSTPVPPLAEARVAGIFNVTSQFVSKSGYGDYTPPAFGWRIKPTCPSGPCAFVLQDINRQELHAAFARTGGTYRATFSGKWEIQCGNVPMTSTGTIVLRVVKARAIDHEWRATRLTGTFTHEEAAQLGCRFSRATLSVHANLYD